MSFRFSIKNTSAKAEREGNEIIRFSGVSEPFRRSEERQSTKVGVDGAGNAKIVFTTGLDPQKVDMYRWLNAEEKKLMKDQITELYPIIESAYGGKEVIDEKNVFFWGRENKELNKVFVTNESEDVFFEVSPERPSHCLLYLSIMAGAFMGLIAPNEDWAKKNQIAHYLLLETDENTGLSEDEDITRSDAHGVLSSLRKESPEDLLILAWCLLSETNSFGGMNKATPQKEILNSFIKYIDGKLVTKRKKNCARNFIKYAEKLAAPLTKQALYVEAYVKAGEYFALINQKEKKYTTYEGTILGNTISEAIENLLKPKFSTDLETLRDTVEKKWSE